MGHQKKRPMLEPVLENYMGPPISYNTPSKPRHGSSAKVAPASEAKHESKGATSLNPLHLFGKLRDRYIKAMNEMSMGGDLASVAGYHGCVAATDPGTVEQHHRSSAREKEIQALREELAALRRKREAEESVAEHHHQHKSAS